MTAEPRRVEADMAAADALRRRTELGWILNGGQCVIVTNPAGGTWSGRIVGLADHPAMLLERDDGRRVMLPQCFAVEQAPEDVRDSREDGNHGD